jgi:Protein of unknown function (DUF3800)
MDFAAYFDESGTHGGSELSCMAGFVGEARQWRKFEKRAGKLFNRFRVDVFHTIDVRRTNKDFKGWTVDRKIEFLDEFHHIINETLECGVSSFIKDEDYKYYCGLDWPRRTRRESKYAILFRACLSHMIDYVGHIPLWKEPRLHIVLEDGHNNANDAVRMYDWAKDRLGQAQALTSLTFDNKKTCLPLAASDLFAYSAWGAQVGQKPIGAPKIPLRARRPIGTCFGSCSRATTWMGYTNRQFYLRMSGLLRFRRSGCYRLTPLQSNALSHMEFVGRNLNDRIL